MHITRSAYCPGAGELYPRLFAASSSDATHSAAIRLPGRSLVDVQSMHVIKRPCEGFVYPRVLVRRAPMCSTYVLYLCALPVYCAYVIHLRSTRRWLTYKVVLRLVAGVQSGWSTIKMSLIHHKLPVYVTATTIRLPSPVLPEIRVYR